jgi:tripeptide aminopeptidase
VQRYCITARTQGGHSWIDYGRPSAIHELARLITRLDGLFLPEQPRTTLNVGVIQGGTSVNTIASEAHLELDLRSEAVDSLEQLIQQMELLINAANRTELAVTAEIIGQRPSGAIPPDHPLVCLALNCLEAQGLRPKLNIGSTDANIPLSSEFILTQPLALGLAQLTDVVTGAFNL